MIPRKYTVPNKRSLNSLQKQLHNGVIKAKFPNKNREQASIFAQIRSGRTAQDDGASGGGRVVGR